jgi:hypothetical protein
VRTFEEGHTLLVRNGKPVIGVEDQLFDVVIFLLIIDWYTPIKEYLCKGYFEDDVLRKNENISP